MRAGLTRAVHCGAIARIVASRTRIAAGIPSFLDANAPAASGKESREN